MDFTLQEATRTASAWPDAVFELRLEDAMRGMASPQDLVSAACAMVGGYLGAAQAALLAMAPDGEASLGSWPHPWAGGCPLLADPGGAIGAALVAGRAVCSADVRLDPLLAAAAVQREFSERGVVALACAPVQREGRVVAVLLAADERPRPWLPEELALLAKAAARAFAACQRAVEVAELRRSEAEHRLAVALCPQVFWTATADGRMDELSPLFGELARKRADQRGSGWRATTHPEDLPELERVIAHCMRTGETYDIEHRTIDPDGQPRWIHSHGKPARGPDGKIVRWFGTITDIDRRKRAEAALRASEDRFMRAIAGARVGTWDWDMGTDEVVTSPGFARQFHDMDGEIRSSRDFLAAIHVDDRERLAAILAGVQDTARRYGSAAYEAEYRVIRQDGEVRWLGAKGKVTVSPGDGSGGRLSGLTVDMSERRRAEELLTATQDRLRALNADLEATVRREVALREQAQALLAQAQRMEALGQLAGGIAHDFNNVLQAVMGGLDLLERQADRPESVRRLAARVGEAASRGVAITGRLLAFARRSDLQAEAVEVLPLLEGLRDLLAPTLQVGITMRIAAAPALPMLLADRAQLETAMVNLAVNARDAMPAGGQITIGAEVAESSAQHAPAGLAGGQYVCVSIQDTGTGMTPEVLAKASEPFFTTKPLGQGTGLGLAMARGFTEQSGGGMVLASRPGEGTRVSLWFPATAGHDADLSGEHAVRSIPHELPRCVMVVDDDDLVRSMLKSQVESLGCLVIEVSDGAEALDRLSGGAPVDVMLTDYAMPGMNGATLASRVRAAYPRLPVVMATGHADADLLVDTCGWDPAVFALLRKPVTTEALADALSRLSAQSIRVSEPAEW